MDRKLSDHRIIHRFVTASEKHGAKTACGIKLTGELTCSLAIDDHGSMIAIGRRGEPFDCSRCIAVLEGFRKGRIRIDT